jgi:hypothetical protein
MKRVKLILCSIAVSTALFALHPPPVQAGITREVLVVLMERPLNECFSSPTDGPGLPRNTAYQWQALLDQYVTPFYQSESYGGLTWQFKVVVDRETADGWWPAKHCSA